MASFIIRGGVFAMPVRAALCLQHRRNLHLQFEEFLQDLIGINSMPVRRTSSS